MAFITSSPLHSLASRRSLPATTRRRCHRTTFATATKPQPPNNFKKPEPRKFFVRPDKAIDIASGSFSQLLRAYAGALIEGYRVKSEDGKLVEYSSTLPASKPDQPLRFFEFEACPFCRKVREAVTMLDLDVLVFPCPKNGKVYREYVKSKGGKAQFPYLEDPNTDFEGYESDEIIKYLYRTYGPTSGRVPGVIGSASMLSAGLASSVRRGKGRNRLSKVVPAAQPIELWGYEASPFVRLVRETLSELELPYYLRSTPRGSPTRAVMKEQVGRFQVPYISDPNTGISMFESAEICEYLRATYGPDAPGALETPTEGSVYMPGMAMGVEEEDKTPSKSLDPQPIRDEVLEDYCEDNPEVDECRIYED